MKRINLVLLLVVLFAGCGQSSRNLSDSTSYNIIIRAEIEEAAQKKSMQNAFELIRFLRPRFLTPRPTQSITHGVIRKDPIIYLNNVRYGTSVRELQNIYYDQIIEVRYLKSSDATTRLGMGHEGGAIMIRTR